MMPQRVVNPAPSRFSTFDHRDDFANPAAFPLYSCNRFGLIGLILHPAARYL
jgi:hypothetical protein